jgi:penicillin-binding protein 2
MQSSPSRDRSTSRKVGRAKQSIFLMLFCAAAILGGLGSRLTYLQVLEGTQNRSRAENNRIRVIARMPERGKILDRKGRLLAGSRLTHSVFLWPMAHKRKNGQRF